MVNDDNDDYLNDEEQLGSDEMEQVKEEFEFEISFYSTIAKTEAFEIIPIPDDRGYVPTAKELKLIQLECKKMGVGLLYRLHLGKHAIIYNPKDLERIGVMPVNSEGFHC